MSGGGKPAAAAGAAGALGRLRRWAGGAAPVARREAPARVRVLMVCMGNICRSPTAEAVLRAKLQRAGIADVALDSAGTHGQGHAGEAPDPRAQRAAAARGYDLSALRARAFVGADFGRFDWIVAMDDANLQWLQRRLAVEAAAGGAEDDPGPDSGPRRGAERAGPDPSRSGVATDAAPIAAAPSSPVAAPPEPPRLALLLSAAARTPGATEVPDPYYGGPAGFEHVLDLIEDACDGWVERLRPAAARR